MEEAHNFAKGVWAAKWLSKTKTCSNQFSPSRDVPLKQERKLLSKYIKTSSNQRLISAFEVQWI